MFGNRQQAGYLLSEKLKDYKDNKDAVIVTIPRGGLPIGHIIAKQLHLPLDVVLSKKIGHPLHKEFAIGAVTLNSSTLSPQAKYASHGYIKEETKRIRDLLKQRQDQYYGTNQPIDLNNKIVIVADDGVATGNTLISSIHLLEQQKPSKIIVALPVAPPETLKKIEALPSVNKVICLLTPNNFQAVGQFYDEFDQIDDKEAIRLLNEAKAQLMG